MSKTILTTTILLIITTFLSTSCKKESSCYDKKLHEQHKNDVCTADCPSVIGCNDKSYCNECEARREGIRLK